MTTLSLARYRRIALKIGSALLVDPATGLKVDGLASVAGDIARLRREGTEVLVVSSGAIALGRSVLGLPRRALRLDESQAAAAAGQMLLARAWDEHLSTHGLRTGQILVTLEDTEARRRYLNARATMNTLIGLGAVPVINENDTVATTEIRYGDNDRLAARVATMMGCDLLILLSDIDGLYTAPPARDPAARHLATVPAITPEIEAMAGGAASLLSRGGMVTKIEAGKVATQAGTAMIIANGGVLAPLSAIEQGARHTLFEPRPGGTRRAWKTWIAGQMDVEGRLEIDAGAVTALRAGKSLLAAGMTRAIGTFERGDPVAIAGPDGKTIARGLVAYDSADAVRIVGRQSDDIEAVLGYPARGAVVHRDDLVLDALMAVETTGSDNGTAT